jgi:curved DNA-binding protein CbpA
VETVGQQPEILRISRGVASFKVDDHYAVLGLAINTDVTQMRKKFLRLAKILHPDVATYSDVEKALATNYFAKMVSPAYQVLNNDRDRAEYFLTLRTLAQGFKQKPPEVQLQSAAARQVLQYPNEGNYIKAVYLMTQEMGGQSRNSEEYGSHREAQDPNEIKVQSGIQLAEMYIGKKQWPEAIRELKIVEKIATDNAKVHALIGVVYMNQNLAIMAKTSFQKALKLDPKNAIALKYLNQSGSVQEKSTSQPAKPAGTKVAKQALKKDDKKGGWFGWGKK